MADSTPHANAAASASHEEVDFAVVICAYTERRWGDLLRATASVRGQTLPPKDLVVVVDGNSELYQRACSELEGATVVENTGEPGLAGARNSGFARTTASVVAFLDDDAEASPDWLEQLATAYRTPNLLGVGGGVEPRWERLRPSWFPREFDWVVGCTYRGVPDGPASVRNPIGANMSVRRDVLDELGGFRLGRLEETDFGIRASRRYPERKWLHWPAARVLHRVPGDRSRFSFFVRRCRNEGRAKASLVRLNSQQEGLSSERSYVSRTLPSGIARELLNALRGDLTGVGRAGAIVAGLLCTTAGYLHGRAVLRITQGRGPVEIARRGGSP